MWYSGNTKEKIAEAKAVLFKYRNIYELPTASKKELEEAQKQIKDLQSSCFHSYEVCTVFTNVERICSNCDLKDEKFKFFV